MGRIDLPNVELVNQDGVPLRFWDDLLRNKIVVVNFVYTECPDICGLSTARMAQVVDWLGERIGKDIFVYSISLDPETDTPQRLRDYADAFDAPDGWMFLTGSPEDVDIVRFKMGERSESLAQHRSDMVIGNAATGEWRRASLMGSLVVLTEEILSLDPAWSRPPPAATMSLSLRSNWSSRTPMEKGCFSPLARHATPLVKAYVSDRIYPV